jgi:hypothetical protein
MAIRTFAAPDGSTWLVWRVERTSGDVVPGAPREWLVFQSEDGTERRRLLEMPPNWEDVSDERLDLLRRIATPAKGWERPSLPGGVKRPEEATGGE